MKPPSATTRSLRAPSPSPRLIQPLLRPSNAQPRQQPRQQPSRSLTTTVPRCKEIAPSYILSASRTPVGVFNGSLASVPAPSLAATAINHALARIPSFDTSHIRTSYIGNVLSASIGQAPARQAILQTGTLPSSVEATTVNKVCSSGLKAVALASQQIALGLDRAVVAGGMENMSRVPYYLPRGTQFPPFGELPLKDGMISDGLWDPTNNIHMGVCAETTASKHKISRDAQDEYAISSYKRAQAAWSSGAFAAEIAPVTIPPRKKGADSAVVKEDEGYNRLKLEKVPTLKPAFVKDGSGTVTAANSSSFNDGASAALLVDADLARDHVKESVVLARIVTTADAALDPIDFPVAPAQAIPIALARAGLEVGDISVWEINEAFAAVVVANARLLGLEGRMERVNPRGGAIALGHAIGSSGCRILTTLVHGLKVGEFGCAAICNGGGAASAMVVQRVDGV